MAAETECAFGSAAGPDGAKVDTNRRENRNMKYGQEAFGEFFRLLEFQSDAAKTQIEDPGPTASLIADDRVGVGAGHGNAFRLALDGIAGAGLWRRGLLRQGPRGGQGCRGKIRRRVLWATPRRDRDGRR
jgi:hypothetical protein